MIVDWQGFYNIFPGRMNHFDCWPLCKGKHRCCKPNQPLLLAPGEGDFLRSKGIPAEGDTLICQGREHCYGDLRPLCCRTFPYHPDVNGMLYANTDCSQYKWASWSFTTDTMIAWGEVLGHCPDIRAWVGKMRQEHYSKMPEVQANDIQRDFDEDYARTFGSLRNVYRIRNLLNLGIIRKGMSVLVCGCGNGNEVKWLRTYGVDAWGIDINKTLIDTNLEPDYCRVGDIRDVPCPDNNFDMVMTVDTLEHIADYHKAFEEMARATRDKVYIEVTTTATIQNLLEDPTHVVMLSPEEWAVELRGYFNIVNHPFPSGWLLGKKGGSGGSM